MDKRLLVIMRILWRDENPQNPTWADEVFEDMVGSPDDWNEDALRLAGTATEILAALDLTPEAGTQ